MECFLSTGIDFLALQNVAVTKGRLHRFCHRFSASDSDVRSIVRMRHERGLSGFPPHPHLILLLFMPGLRSTDPAWANS